MRAAQQAVDRDEEVQESQPLLSRPAQGQPPAAADVPSTAASADKPAPDQGTPSGSPRKAAQQHSLLSKQSSGVGRAKSQELGQCRICLEEDALTNLETPCSCTGTQRHAHKECIQKWVNEKHHTTCEICDTPYKGSYVVPPPPPPTPGEPLTLVSPMGNLYLTAEDERVAGQLLHDVYDEWDDRPHQHTVSWCFSFMMLLIFMMILQSTMTVPADGSGGAGGPAGAGGTPSPSSGPSGGDPSGGAAAAAGSAAVGLVAGLSLVVVWLVSKLFLVVLPLLMLMRLASRAQEQAAEAAAAAAAGTVPGLDGPTQPVRGGSSAEVVDRDHPLVTIITRLAAARAAAQARQMQEAAAAAAGAGAGGAGVDVEMQAASQQARRAALGRLGRDPIFWGAPAAAGAAAGSSSSAASSSGSGAAVVQQQDEQQEHQSDAAAAHRLASLRSLMAAIRAAAMRAEVVGPQQQQQQAPAADGSSGADSARRSMV